ncbi:MAG TPA: flagellar hook-length control protein FliK [Methylophilaceae bacterium]|nr:flagellar hook-length control protein FliK [Methylophilaceae bacterium]
MIKPSLTAGAGLVASPLVSVSDIKPVAAVGAAGQEFDFRGGQFLIDQLVKGQSYQAQVISQLDGKTFRVAIEGHHVAIALGPDIKAGQSLLLKYISDTPAPTFILVPPPADEASSTATLSPTAQLINQKLQAAQHQGAAVYEAALPITASPANPQRFAADLKDAVATSGLFYESHLAEFVEGARPLGALMREPQNQGGPYPAHLLAQQLGVLENQRMLWHGEIWPGQMAEWRIQAQQQGHSQGQRADHEAPAQSISSSMTLQLPHLGKITARLQLADGKLRVALLAEESATVASLRQHTVPLLEALHHHVAALDGFAVMQDEPHE